MRRSVLVSLVGVIVPSLALAQSGDRAADQAAEANRLFNEARVLAEAGQYDQACPLFERSYELDPAPGALLNLAECAEHDGRLALAWRRFENAAVEFDRIISGGDEAKLGFARSGLKMSRERAAALMPKLVLVVVRVAAPDTPGLTLRIGGRDVRLAPEVSDRVEPGPIEVTAQAPGHEPFSETAQAVAGTSIVIAVPQLRSTAAAASVTRRRGGRVKLALGLGAAGGGALIASGVLSVLAYRQNSRARDTRCGPTEPPQCDEQGVLEIERAGRKADLATGLGIAGVALAAGAAIIYYTAPRERVTVTPVASHRALGLGLVARF